MFPPRRYDAAGNLFRLVCPFCKAESPLWFRPEETSEGSRELTEWEIWLDKPCHECGKIPRTAVVR